MSINTTSSSIGCTRKHLLKGGIMSRSVIHILSSWNLYWYSFIYFRIPQQLATVNIQIVSGHPWKYVRLSSCVPLAVALALCMCVDVVDMSIYCLGVLVSMGRPCFCVCWWTFYISVGNWVDCKKNFWSVILTFWENAGKWAKWSV